MAEWWLIYSIFIYVYLISVMTLKYTHIYLHSFYSIFLQKKKVIGVNDMYLKAESLISFEESEILRCFAEIVRSVMPPAKPYVFQYIIRECNF